MPNPYEQIILGGYKGGYGGRNSFNPWVYMDPEQMKIAEENMMSAGYEQNPGAMGPPVRLGSSQDSMDPISERKYQDWIKSGNQWVGENVVNPMGAAGYPNMGAGFGAALSTGLDLIPGPEGFGFGMAGGGGGKKIESIFDYMNPEARKAAEEAMAKQREMMGGSESAGPIDPYATDSGNPYEGLKKYDEMENRVIDPDTGLPMERRAPDSPFRESNELVDKIAAEKKVPKSESEDLDTFMESLSPDAGYEDDWWYKFDQDNNYEIHDSWERDWIDDNYNHNEVPTEYDRAQGQIDAFDYYASDIIDKIKDDISERIDQDNLPQRFRIKHANQNAEDAEILRRWEDNESTDKDEDVVNEWLDDWAQEEAENAFEAHQDNMKKYRDELGDSGDEEIDWHWIDDNERYDFSMADYGDERIFGDVTRRRRYESEYKGEKEIIAKETDERTSDSIFNEIYDNFQEPLRGQNTKEWWENSFFDDGLKEQIIDDMVDPVPGRGKPLDQWDEKYLKDYLREVADDMDQNAYDDLIYHLNGRVGAQDTLKNNKKVREQVDVALDNIADMRKRSLEKALDNEDIKGILDDLKKEAKELQP